MEDPAVKAWKEKIKKDAKDPDSLNFASTEFVVDPEKQPASGKTSDITTQAS